MLACYGMLGIAMRLVLGGTQPSDAVTEAAGAAAIASMAFYRQSLERQLQVVFATVAGLMQSLSSVVHPVSVSQQAHDSVLSFIK